MSSIKHLEYKIYGDRVYKDDRGKIINYELPEHINWMGLITSKKGTMRANHYHPKQEQKVILVMGRFVSVLKDLRIKDGVVTTQIINEGEVSVIPPNIAHTMIFLEDSVFINLVNGEREHKNFGDHTIPYELVDEDQKCNIIENYKSNCRICDYHDIQRVISLGNSPMANNLLVDETQKDELFPLELGFCPDCLNVQLSYVVPPHHMFDNYLYVSSTGESFRKHFSDAAEQYIKEFNLNEDSLVVDIGSNDGIFLKPLKEKGIQVVGVEPAENIAKIANDNGIKTLNEYFNYKTVKKITGSDIGALHIKDRKRADLVTASNVFAHTDGIKTLTLNVFDLLKKDGTFIIECQYLLDTIKDLTFDNIYHEHVSYFSVLSLFRLFLSLNCYIQKVEHIDTHGGSIRVYVKKSKTTDFTDLADKSVEQFLLKEKKFGLDIFDTYKDFSNKIEQKKERILHNIKLLKNNGKSIVGYGSPAKATTVLNYYGIGTDYIDFIIEDNKLKQGYLLPGMRIPIKSKEDLDYTPDYILVLAWNFKEEIKNSNKDLVDKGVQFITLNDLDVDKYKLK